MSDTPKRPRAQAIKVAEKVVAALDPCCTWIEMAGSLRRQTNMVGDIEIVAIPAANMLYDLLDEKIAAGTITHLAKKRWGLKQRSFWFAGWQFDIFIQPDPLTMPVNFMIRTGCADFSHRMVTRKSAGGWMPDWYEIKDAKVWCDGEDLLLEDERDIFDLWGIDYVEPTERTDSYRPVQFYPVRPATEKRDMFSEETFVPVETARAMQPVASEQGTISHSSCRFSFSAPLPERFKTWSFQVSSDAGTPAARERAIEAARAAQNR